MSPLIAVPALIAALAATEPQTVSRATSVAPNVHMNTLYGPTGLINVPTANTAERGVVGFGAGFAKDFRGPTANWGVVDSIEVGGAFLDRTGADSKAIANAKVKIVPSNFNWFDVGVGVIDVADAINQTFYVVGSAAIVPPNFSPDNAFAARIHAGVGTGLFSEKLFAGGEIFLNNKTALVGEWDSKNFNAAFRFRHMEMFAIQAGVANKGLFLSSTVSLKF